MCHASKNTKLIYYVLKTKKLGGIQVKEGLEHVDVFLLLNCSREADIVAKSVSNFLTVNIINCISMQQAKCNC